MALVRQKPVRRCVECGCLPPGHRLHCVSDSERARESQRALEARGLQEITAGGFTLRRLGDGKFWLEHPEGEGLQTSEAAVAGLLAGFFGREF